MEEIEVQFAAWLRDWADALDVEPGWRDLLNHDGVSAADTGFPQLYFPILEQVRQILGDGARPAASAGVEPRVWTTARARLGRIRERLRTRLHHGRPASRLFPIDGDRTALVIRAAANATAFPVLRVLQDELGWRLVFASWSRTVEPRVRALGVPYLYLGDEYRRQYSEGRRRHERDVSAALGRLDVQRPAALLSDIAGRALPVDVMSLLREACIETRVQTDLYRDLLARAAPSVVLFFNESTLRERTAARVAALAGVKTVTIQHGLYVGYVYRVLATDRLIVWGREPRHFWLATGSPPERLISVGGIGHDGWRDAIASSASRGRGTTPATVLVLGQNPAAFISAQLYQDCLRAVLEAAAQLTEVKFVIRPHPGESVGSYERALQSAPASNVTLESQGDLVGLLSEVDVVVTIFSTAGLEAMLLGTPVVVLNPSEEPSLAPYASATVTADSGAALAQAIDRIVRDSTHRAALVAAGRAYADAYFGPLDGQAARRAAAVIEELRSES